MKSIIKYSVIAAALVALPLPVLAAPGGSGDPGGKPGMHGSGAPGGHQKPGSKPGAHKSDRHDAHQPGAHRPDSKPGRHEAHKPAPKPDHKQAPPPPPPAPKESLLQRSLLRWFGW